MVGGVRRHGGCDSGGGVMGEAPDGTSIYLGTLRVEIKLRIYLILLIFRGVRLKAYLYFGSLFEREIIEFHSTFSRHGNAQASLTLLIWLNEKVQKLSSKINRATRRN